MTPLPAVLLIIGLTATTAPATPDPPETIEVVVPADSELARAGADGLGQAAAQADGPWVSVEVPLEGSVEQTLSELSDEVGEPVSEEQTLELFDPVDEPLFPEEWHLQNNGQARGTTDADVDAPAAWGRSVGAGIVVAVIDSGVAMDHPDLADRIHPARRDFVEGDNDPSPGGTSFGDGHGTRVAGVIAAADNGLGVAGVAPGARIMALRACTAGGCNTTQVANAIHFAVDNGAHIINLSIGAILPGGGAVAEEVEYARAHDVTIVAAAGNNDPGFDLDQLPPDQVMVPGGLPHSNVVAVAATDRNDRLASFSNYGRNTVDVAAPGVEIYTTEPGGGYDFAHGTSFSSPLVAGVAALLLSADRGIGHQELIARVEAFVDRPGIVGSRVESGRVNAGRTLNRRFVDTSGSVFLAAIEHLAALGITQGCNPPHNTNFCPENHVSRGQMAVFLARAFDLPQASTDYFDDDAGTFYESAANRMAAAGLTTGCAPNRYCGGQAIPRGQMAAMLSRGLGLPRGAADRFVDDGASVFEGAINRVAAAGITFGCNPPRNDRFCPGDRVTRGQMAAFITRSLDLINS